MSIAKDFALAEAAAGSSEDLGVAGSTKRRAWVWLDVSATCNLACELCYTTALRSAETMSVENFVALADRLLAARAHFVRFHLNWRGEPTSNRHLADMIHYLSSCDPSLEIEWHTNGTLLTPATAAKLVGASARQLIYVSLDGGNASSFEATRGVGTWPRALRGLEALIEARGGRSQPYLGIYQLDLGVLPTDYDPRFSALLDRVDVHRLVAPVAVDGGPLGAGNHVPRGPCFWLGNALAIDCHGQAFTCLLATATPLGSVLETDVDELLIRAQSLRDVVSVGGRQVLKGCSRCRKLEGDDSDAAG